MSAGGKRSYFQKKRSQYGRNNFSKVLRLLRVSGIQISDPKMRKMTAPLGTFRERRA
jgi:hypothetical protein